MQARVYVTLKPGVLDPQGKAVSHALVGLGFKGVEEVRVGKYIQLDLADMPQAEAEKTVRAMCEQLLANTVIEKYDIQFS